MGYQDWPQPTDAMETFRQTEKRMQRQERRPVIQKASDLLGPGVAPYAVEISTWRAQEATFNGFYWTQPGVDKDAPDVDHFWIGQTTATADGFGIQRVLTFHDTAYFPPKTYWRQFHNVSGSVINYGTWQSENVIAHPEQPLVTAGSPGDGMSGFTVNSDGTGEFHGATQPYYAREFGTNQGVNDGSNVVLTGWSTLVASLNGGGWNYSSGVFTCVMAGQWSVAVGVKFEDNNVAGFRRIFLTKNGVGGSDAFAQGNAVVWDTSTDSFVQAVGLAHFDVGDEVRVVGRISGANADALAGPGLQAQFQRISA